MPAPALHELPMRWADLDMLDHVNNVVYLDYAAESRGLLVDDGVLDADHRVARMAVRFERPLLLTRHPVTVASTLDGDTLTQEIRLDRATGSTVHARVETVLGEPGALQPAGVDAEPHPLRPRRSDVGPDGQVTPVKIFEYFQEGRILFVSGPLTSRGPGSFVVGSTEVVYGAPAPWRREPHDVRSWVGRIGTSSIAIESELSHDAVVHARATTVLVGFDRHTQRSRPLRDEERAALEAFQV